MTREEAVSIIEERIHVTEYVESSYVDCVDIEALRMAIKALEQPEQKWIPCKERLPEDGKKRYWVCTDTGYQCECRWTNVNHIWTDLTIDWHWHMMDIPQYSHVVAWRELPEPYKEEGNE